MLHATTPADDLIFGLTHVVDLPGLTAASGLPISPDDIAAMSAKPYAEALGALQYASVATRPDITYVWAISKPWGFGKVL